MAEEKKTRKKKSDKLTKKEVDAAYMIVARDYVENEWKVDEQTRNKIFINKIQSCINAIKR